MEERGGSPEEYGEAYRRILERLQELVEGNRSVLERLSEDLRTVLRNEEATRRLLSEEVYGVPDGRLDELLRARLEELDR